MSSRPGLAVMLAALLTWAGHGVARAEPPADPLCAEHVAACAPPPYVLVLGAMPSEVTSLLARTTTHATIADGTRHWWIGTVGRVPVVVGRTGIGVANAAAATREALARFRVWAVVVSGVSGGRLDVGDVAVPAVWHDADGGVAADPAWLAAAAGVVPALVECSAVPPEPPGPVTCLGRRPRIVVGGVGRTGDDFGGVALPCTPGGDPVTGCDDAVAPRTVARDTEDAVDMETAAVARVAAAAGVPFLGVRALSDGGGDPLGLPGFPAQFFAWYGLAAENAAAVTAAVVRDRADARPRTTRRARRRPPADGVGAACDWERAGGAACDGARADRTVTRAVSAACAAATRDPGAAVTAWRRAATHLAQARGGLGARCREPLAALLAARAR
jgi:nucleoside phosphorylase